MAKKQEKEYECFEITLDDKKIDELIGNLKQLKEEEGHIHFKLDKSK